MDSFQYNQPIIVMSYEFHNPTISISRTFSRQFWAKTLELAELYGWQPRGTQPPVAGVDWLGSYSTNDGQVVVMEDAFLLAGALEKALSDIADTNPSFDWDPALWVEDDLPAWLSTDERALIEEGLQDGLLDIVGVHPRDYFAGDEKRRLREFIRFCRLGSFRIF